MKKRTKTKQSDADDFVAKVEAAIEAGEFTPDTNYFQRSMGPCGCAVAAGCFVAGIKTMETDVKQENRLLRKLGIDHQALEAGYEAGYMSVGEWGDYFLEGGSDLDPSYLAGVELRKFHPRAG